MNLSITIKGTIQIKADREAVWDFTQDPTLRSVWDHTVKQCKMQQRTPRKVMQLKMLGGIITDLTYKLCRKPIRTSLKLTNTSSWLFKGGGGSWTYNQLHDQTEWTQVNTLVFRNRLLYWFFSKPIHLIFQKMTSNSMLNAKRIIEGSIT